MRQEEWAIIMMVALMALALGLVIVVSGCTDSPTAPPAVEQVDGTIVETCDGLLRNVTECN